MRPLDKSIEMWKVLAETGLTKEEYFAKHEPGREKPPPFHCYLCEAYVDMDCISCPIFKAEKAMYGCAELGIGYAECKTVEDRIVAAKIYVTYLIELRENTNGR